MSTLVREDFDVVIFLGDWKYLSTWVGQVLVRLKRSKPLLWTIGWHRPDRGLKKHLRLAFYRLADKLLLYGPDGKDIGANLKFPLERMVVIGNSHASGLSEDGLARSDRQPRKAHTSPFTVGAVVRLQASKRLDLLLRALGLLADQGECISALIVGDGPARESLQQLAGELDLDVHFTGAVYDADSLREIYARLDITVLPDAAGLTVMQSLAHGVPVITANSPFTQMPEFRAVVEGVTGGLYDPVEAEPLADKILAWKRILADDCGDVSRSCLAEINKNWTPRVHALRVREAIRATLDSQ